MNAYEYAQAHRDEFVGDLLTLLKIPSVSTLEARNADTRRAAEWLRDQLTALGLDHVQLFETPGHPLVYADWLKAPGQPTVLIYGHYDVQPADGKSVDPNSEWLTEPFSPDIRDGNLFARGAADDKGQVFIHVKAVESLLRTVGKLPINVKFIIEGEEEKSSVNIDAFVNSHSDLLQADVCVISDSHILATDRPLIVYGLRGMVYTEIEVFGPAHDVHSGSYGGVVYNPLQALCEIIAGLHNPDGSINVPGFYDKVRPISVSEHDALEKIPWTTEELLSETGLSTFWGEPGITPREQVGLRPTLEVHGLVGGFIEPGQKTVLPAKALAKVSCRLVADQVPEEIFGLLQKRVAALTPKYVRSEIRLMSTGLGAHMDIDSVAMDAAAAAYEHGFGARPVYLPEGGSIPVVATLQNKFHFPVLLIGFGLPDDNLHGPNEKFKLDHFYRGIDTSIALYEQLGKLTPAALMAKSSH
jgi:acetylornithine deacetylase/succinyl-diaminopimelate desuccinylase-like protein